MNLYISPKTSFDVVRFIAKKLQIWPSSKYTRWQGFSNNFIYIACLLNCLIMSILTVYALYLIKGNIKVFSISWLEFVGLIESTAIMIFSKCQHNRLKFLLDLAEKQLSAEKPKIIQQYANLYALAYLGILWIYLIILILYIRNDNLETTRVIFLKTGSIGLKMLVLFQQIVSLLTTAVIPSFDGVAILLIFTCTERLKILEDKFKNAKNLEHLMDCIQEHYNVLYVIKETNYIVRFITFKTVMSFMFCTFGIGLTILNSTDYTTFVHQVFIFILVYSRISVCAESAQNMTSAGDDIPYVLYSSKWYEETSELVKAKILIIHRCQKIPTISVNGVMSEFGREYLKTILSATLSYLLTLRTIVGTKY